MAEKEFLMNKNNVAYCTSLSRDFEPNKEGVLVTEKNMNSFCFTIATKNIKPEYPMIRVVKAIPNKNLKEKWIEKTFYVTVPVKAQKEDLDEFLKRAGDFQVDFKESVGYSIKGIAKIRKGDVVRYRDRIGAFEVIFGDKAGGSIDFTGISSSSGGPSTQEITLDVKIKVSKDTNNSKNRVLDSLGKDFSFYESPLDDVEEKIDEIMKAEVETICRSSRFKIFLSGLRKGTLKDEDQSFGKFSAKAKAIIMSV